MIDEKLCDEALERIARTPDGRMLYLKLQKVMMGIVAGTKSGALRVNHGRRSLAAELMAVMAEAMSETKPSDDPRGRPVIFSLAKPVAIADASARGARRRVSPDPVTDS